MGLKNFVRRQALARVLKEVPMLGKAWNWLTDPAHSGRKRGLAAVLLAVAAAGRVLAPVIVSACAPPDPTLPSWACHAASLDVGGYMEILAAWLQGLDSSATAAGSLVLLWGLFDARRKSRKIAPVLLALLLLPGLASAQEGKAPLSASQAAESVEGVTIDAQTWTLALLTRDERREYAGGRVTLDAPAGPVRLFARADIAGTQSDAFDFGDYSSFRSIELFVGARYPFRSGAALAVAGGVTYSIEGKDGPADPRIYSALALVRLPLPGGGYAYAGGGHRGPVGGLAAVASVSYPVGLTRAIVDYDFPLQVDAAGQPRPWVLRTGIAVPLKRWVLGGRQ